MQAPRGYVATLALLLCEKQNHTHNVVWQNALLAEINQAYSSVGQAEIATWDELIISAKRYTPKIHKRESPKHSETPSSSHPSPTSFKGRYLPQPRYRVLHGRTRELKHALRFLSTRRAPPMLLIEGPPGNGKTALAREIAEKVLTRPMWADVLWISAEQMGIEALNQPNRLQLTLDELVQQLCTQTGLANRSSVFDEQIQMLQTLFRQRKYLIVLDNLEASADEQDILRQIQAMLGRSRLLVTTRSRNLYRAGLVRGIALKGLTLASVAHYLKQETQGRGLEYEKHFSSVTIQQIYQATDGTPLLLEWFIQDMQLLTLQPALDNLLKRFADHQDQRYQLYTRYFLKRWNELSHAGKQLWIFIALFIPASFSQKLLMQLSPLSNELYAKAFAELVQYGIIETTVNSADDTQRASLHPLVRNFITQGLRTHRVVPRWLAKFYHMALIHAARGWERLCNENRKILNQQDERQAFLHVVQECMRDKNYTAVRGLHEPASTDLFFMGYLHEYRQFQLMCLEAAHQLRDRKRQAQIESELGWLELTRKNWDASQKLIGSALAYYRKTQNVRWTLITRRYLVTIALERGEYEIARTDFRRLLKELRQVLKTATGETRAALLRQEGIIHDSLGIALCQLGSYKASERELKRGLALVPPGENAALAISLFNLGKLHLLARKWRQAKSYLEKCLDVSRTGHYHGTEADTLEQLAILSEKQKNLALAIQFTRQALEIYQTLQDTQKLQQLENLLKRLVSQRA